MTNDSGALLHTPLFDTHLSLGARMTPFAGWEMPLQYAGIVSEHLAVRENAGLFDVSHMGEIFLTGDPSVIVQVLEKLTCNNVATMNDGRVRYNAVLNEQGGLIDDVTVYRFAADRFMVCSNASNYDKVYAQLQRYAPPSVQVRNESLDWHLLALQGPKAAGILRKVLNEDTAPIGYYRFETLSFMDKSVVVSRTGYTGEDGFELYSDNTTGPALWSALLQAGSADGLMPAGLGARDTLRLEAAYPLYGHELNETRTPVESGISFIVKEKSSPYLGYERIVSHLKNGPAKTIAGFRMTEPGIARDGCKVLDEKGGEIGIVTSGTHSPTLKQGIGLVYIDKDRTNPGTRIHVDIRGNLRGAEIVATPFVRGKHT